MTSTAAAKSELRSALFWPAAWLIIALVAIKASYVRLSSFWTWATPKDYLSILYFRWLAAMSYRDVLFAVGLTVVAGSIALLLRRRPRARRIVFWIFVGIAAFCVLYALASRQIFSYYAAPLTYQLLTLSGEPGKMWSSIEPFLTMRTLLTLALVPLCYIGIAWLSARQRAGRWIALVLVVAWLFIGQQFARAQPLWFTAQDRHLAESPHAAFLFSLLAQAGARANIAATTVRAEDLSEFNRSSSVSPGDKWQQVISRRGVGGRKNVIVIVLESVGAQHLALFGSKLATTPRLNAEQSNALVFDRYYAPVAWTAYSLIALLKSQQPEMARYNTTSFRNSGRPGVSLPDVLRQSGYRTAFVSAGDPDWAGGHMLEQVGFQETMRGTDLADAKQISSWGTEDRFMFKGMLDWIDKHRQEPFFLMAWTDQTHNPYRIGADQTLPDVIPPNGEKHENFRRYLALVREVDNQIGGFLDGLRQRGLADSTIVVITGDHGEAFGNIHGGGGHGFTVYDEEVRVPLVIWNPPMFSGAGRSDIVGSHIDLAPTILNMVGIDAPAGWDGRTLMNATKPPRTFLFAAAWGEYLLGVREANIKYIYDAREGREELYDLAADPDEKNNRAAGDRGKAQRLRQRLAAWLQHERGRSEPSIKNE